MRALLLMVFMFSLSCWAAESNPPTPSGVKPQQENRQDAKKTQEKSSSPAQTSHNVPPLLNIVNNAQATRDAAQQAKQQEEKSSAEWWTVGVAIVAAGIAALAALIAAIQAGLFVWQLRHMKTANETAATTAKAALKSVGLTEKQFIASHRPWIKVGIKLTGDLMRDTLGGWKIEVSFKMKNVGSTVAQNVYPNPWIYAGEGFVDEIKNFQLKLAAEFKPVVDTNTAGYTIFPGQSFTVPVVVHVTKADAEDPILTHAEMGFGDCLPKLFIVGSAHYKSTIGELPHRTGFIRSLGYIDATKDKVVLIPKQDNVSRDRLVLGPHICGDGYID